jgi:hypothetical protein
LTVGATKQTNSVRKQHKPKHDRYCGGFALGGRQRQGAIGDDHIRFLVDEGCSLGLCAGRIFAGPSIIEMDIASLDPAEFIKSLSCSSKRGQFSANTLRPACCRTGVSLGGFRHHLGAYSQEIGSKSQDVTALSRSSGEVYPRDELEWLGWFHLEPGLTPAWPGRTGRCGEPAPDCSMGRYQAKQQQYKSILRGGSRPMWPHRYCTFSGLSD